MLLFIKLPNICKTKLKVKTRIKELYNKFLNVLLKNFALLL